MCLETDSVCGGVRWCPVLRRNDTDLTLAPKGTHYRRDLAGEIGLKVVFHHTAASGGSTSKSLVEGAMASRMSEGPGLEWKQARQWLIEGGVIPPVHPATKPGADLVDFARCLRDGVYLCLTLNRLKPNCVQYTARPYMQVSYVRNINAFLTACHREFGIPEEQLFEEGDLYDVADFQKVIRLLSRLSRSPQSLDLGLTAFPDDVAEEENALTEESIYANLEDIEWSAETIDVQEMERIYDVVPTEDDEDPYGDESIYAAVVTYHPVPPAVSATQVDKKKHIIMEMYETEKSFVSVLENIAEAYHAAMAPHLPQEDIELLFYLPRQLLNPHRKLLTGFTQCSQNLSLDVAQFFLNEQSGLLQYGTYAATMPAATKKAKQLQESRELGKVMQETQGRSARRFPLSDLLSVPMQRILKYPLLIRELVKCAEKEKKPGHKSSELTNLYTVLETLQDIAKYVNETKRDFECLRAISEIEQSIVEWKGQNQLGRYHLDGELKVKSDDEREGRKKWFFLFDKSLIVCKKRMGLGLGALRYNMKDVIETQSIVLGDMPNQHLNKTKLVYPFRVSVPTGSCTSGAQSMICFARTEEHKKQWMESIRNAMLVAKPVGALDGNHDFELETFDKPTHCSYCKKLLWGTYFQGYVCQKCKMPCHDVCLKHIDTCASSPIQDGKVPKTPPPIQTFGTKRPTIVKSGEPPAPGQGSIYYAREKYDNPLRGSAHGALMLAKGEEVEIINALDMDWWEVISLRTGNRGRVPPSYLKKKEDIAPKFTRPRSPDSDSQRNPPWFVGRMSRLSSEQLLHNAADGVFLIRESDQRHGGFAVALRWKQMPRHIKIQKNPATQRLFVSDAKDFHSVTDLVEYYRQVSLGASFPGVDTTLLYPYWEVANKEVSSSAGSAGLSRRTTTTADSSRRPTSTSAITATSHSPDQLHRKSLPVLVDGNSVRRTSSGAGPVSPPIPVKAPISNGDPSHNPPIFCEAVYSFKAEYPGELSLQRHCRIRILSKETDRPDWWLGEYNGKKGFFPANYVKELH